ncbi:hypothetical protein Cs7R123_33410 [Catellatospora sp. TT07R-123]|uniref:hypothetical protein n=1 Tax=Catellatospora sp. TT07R-123 TaxID=2733863 RepID=UPI001B1EA1DD|nr:hypothetical protein [Catellatospora sp. TT07R-123]GHJ45999.1 hypothetical protein Cs7R123_33410 [Catellatospora sp. TT07R-123]
MRAALTSLMCASLLLTAGCQVMPDGGAPMDRSRLIADMTAQVHRANEHGYHAEYLLSGGVRGDISQHVRPTQASYAYPGGRLMAAADGLTSCVTAVRPARCQVRPVPKPGPLGLAPYNELVKHGLVSGPVLAELLGTVEVQSQATVEAHDTTVAGQQATCLEVSGLIETNAAGFTVCVTSDGVLASFNGVLDGVEIDQALLRLSPAAPDDVFAVPSGAKVVDHRPSTAPKP